MGTRSVPTTKKKRAFLSTLANKVSQKVGEAKKNAPLPFPLITSAVVKKYLWIINYKSLRAYQPFMKLVKFLKKRLKN